MSGLDAEIESIKELFKISLENKDCAISAPLLLSDKDGYGTLPEKWIKSKIKTVKKEKNFFHKNPKPSGNICVDVAKGCALLINSKHFKCVGMFSKEYFLFNFSAIERHRIKCP